MCENKKKKCNKNRKNNTREVKLEIDYDKLAEAIVKANNAKDDSSEEMQTKSKVGIIDFFRVVYYIIFNRRKTNGTMTSTLMGGMLSFAFNGLALFGLFILICSIVYFVLMLTDYVWTADTILNNIVSIILSLSIVVIVAMSSLFFRGCANEMNIEKDRNYIVAVFSGIVSFAALIVALIALFKGVE